jgi:hypothetical protein
MDRLWKSLMRLDAKALFFGSAILFALVIAVVVWLRFGRAAVSPAPAARTASAALAANAALRLQPLGVLACVSNQLSPEAILVPVCPFRPSIENLIASDRIDPYSIAASTNFRSVFVRRINPNAAARNGADRQPRPPTLAYRGFFQRPDGTPAALFFDSANNASQFVTNNTTFHGARLVSADIRAARILMPDGSTRELSITNANDTVTLPEVKP